MRVMLYIITNLLVVLLLGVVMRVFGVEAWLMSQGISANTSMLLIYAAGFGFFGSFISLALSKTIAKRTTGAKVITEPANSEETWLVDTVRKLAEKSDIDMPEVAIFPSGDPNAFATGMRRNAALVAVSEGLLRTMNQREVEAVLAHEVAHVANGDMVTMSLLQGILNTFVIFLSRAIGMVVDNALSGGRDRRGGGMGYFATVMALQVVFGLLASVVVAAFSRWREYRADAGAAALVGKEPMIAALNRLAAAQHPGELPEQLAAFGIRGGPGGGFRALFRSHPHLADRVEALRDLEAPGVAL